MRLITLALASALLFCTHPLVAQTSAPSADPISGVWNGNMARDADRLPITITFKFDGSNITGTITGPPSPGVITSGTFDKATGALKFQVEVQDGSKTLVAFEGKVEGDKAAGQVTLNNQTGTFALTKGAAGAADAPPSRPGGMSTSEALQKSFASVSTYIAKSAEMIPADKYNYKPTDSVRTVGQLIGHVADGYNYYCTVAAKGKAEWSDAAANGPTDKATIVGKLKQAADACSAAYIERRTPSVDPEPDTYEPALRQPDYLYADAGPGAAVKLGVGERYDELPSASHEATKITKTRTTLVISCLRVFESSCTPKADDVLAVTRNVTRPADRPCWRAAPEATRQPARRPRGESARRQKPSGSFAVTPNRNEVINCARPNAAARPSTTPTSARRIPCATTILLTCEACAPSASRMPISCVRCSTEYAIKP